jgi:DNA-binding NarL/FixJ family response regulator
MQRFLDAFPEVEVVGRGCSGAEAIELADRLKPDLVLLDYMMPGMDGPEVTRRWKSRPGGPRVVILTLHDDAEHRAAALAAGADGFLPKSSLITGLIPLLREMRPESAGQLPLRHGRP